MRETMADITKLFPLTGDSDEPPGLPILPDDLILEILLMLPVRSLLQFKCVCKSWKTLISHPQFAKDHLRTSTANPSKPHQRFLCPTACNRKIRSFSVQSLFQKDQNPSNLAKPVIFSMMGDSYTILGSCNGLLCLCDSLESSVKLWNPSIGLTSKTIPTGINRDERMIQWGFGYDHVNDKYKLVVGLGRIYPQTETVTKIYTFGSNSCRVIQNFPGHPLWWQGKFVSGTLNWLSMSGAERIIISFDLGTETCGEVLLPDGDQDNISNPRLHVLRDCLCVSFFDLKKVQSVVWLMKEYGVHDSWTKLTVIPQFVEGDWIWTELMLYPRIVYGVRSHLTLDFLGLSEDGVLMLECNRCEVVLLNSNYDRLDCPRINTRHGLHIYYESLVSPP